MSSGGSRAPGVLVSSGQSFLATVQTFRGGSYGVPRPEDAAQDDAPVRLKTDESRCIAGSEWDSWQRRLDELGFWQLKRPSEAERFRVLADGTLWFLEGKDDGMHRAVMAQSPEDGGVGAAVRAFCTDLFEASGFQMPEE
jgi:hypothetical protein